jgi:hypothetical protein
MLNFKQCSVLSNLTKEEEKEKKQELEAVVKTVYVLLQAQTEDFLLARTSLSSGNGRLEGR